jgi:hypothetical protein
MSRDAARYVAKLEWAFSYLDKAVKNLGDAHFLADDEHKKLGTHDLLNRTIKVRDGLATLVDIAQKQLRAHKFTPTNGNLYRCSVCGQPNYDCTGERPEAEGLIKRNPQAVAEEDQL